jgi:hypothetical protein
MLGDETRCPRLLITKLRVLVDVPAPVDHLLLDVRRALANVGLKARVVCPRCGCGREQQCYRKGGQQV